MTMTTKILLLPLITLALAGCVQERRDTPTDYGMVIHPDYGELVRFWRDSPYPGDCCPRCGTCIAEPMPGTEWKRVKVHVCSDGVAK